MSRLSHSHQPTMDMLDRKAAIANGNGDLLPDMCRQCADDANTPWPAGATGIFSGTCHSCGNTDRALMPVADLVETDFAEVTRYA